MNYILKGITYSYNRNIGWQDRTVRSLVGIGALAGAGYCMNSNLSLSVALAFLFMAQLITVISAKCIICYFAGACTIGINEKKSLDKKRNAYEQ
jgi:hypothetical protein